MTGIRYPAALDDLHARVAPGRLVPAPDGRALASTTALPQAPQSPLTRWGLAVGDPGIGNDAHISAAFATGLLDLHHELVREALRHALSHLTERTSGGASLLSRQLLQAQCAQIAMSLSEDRAMPAENRGDDRSARWRAHRRLVDAGRSTLRLLGASGFLSDSPAADLHLAELVGQFYLQPEDQRDDDD